MNYPKIQVHRLKRAPSEFKKYVEDIPELLHKQFYFTKELDPMLLLSDNLMNTVLKCYRSAYKLLREALIYRRSE